MISNGTYEYAVKMRRQIHMYPEIGLDQFAQFIRDNQDGIDFSE